MTKKYWYDNIRLKNKGFGMIEIKKVYLVGFIFLIFIICLLAGCLESKSETVLLSRITVADEQIYKLNNGKAEITFEVPDDGYLKISAYDYTEYEMWPDETPEIILEIFDDEGKALYEKINVNNGYTDKILIKKGRVSAIFTVKNSPQNMREIAVSWAFAYKNTQVSKLENNETATAKVGNDKKAQFKLDAVESGIYSISCSEACLNENDCYFTVFDLNGKPITEKVFIHQTEWTSRKIYLPKGEYTITVEDVFSVALCTVKKEKTFKNIVLPSDEKLEIPVDIGFLNGDSAEMKFEANGGKLIVSAVGIGTYYDCEQFFEIEIAGENGKIFLKEECEGSLTWNIPENFGKGFIKVTVKENGVVTLNID